MHNAIFKKMFREFWSSHRCEVTGCGSWLVCDGGLKPHRVVCAARYSGIHTYRHTNIKTVTGCTKKPAKDQQFCSDHQEGKEGPVVLAEKLSSETKSSLRKKQSLNYPQDNIFFVRALLKVSGDKFLVRWANFPLEEATWEPRNALPKFIVEWYEMDTSRLGSEIPTPRIKWNKVVKLIHLHSFLFRMLAKDKSTIF